MGNRWGNSGNSVRLYFSGLQNHCRWWLHHEIKRYLLIGSQVMTNLDSILRSRDSTLQTMVHLIRDMVFPVVMYGCESWTIRKAENWRIDAIELWYWRRLLSLSRSGGEKGLRRGGAGKPQCSSRGRPGFRGTLWVASRVPSALSTSNS